MQYIVAKIHNNSLGRVVAVNSESEGKAIVRAWAEEQFQRPLDNEEIDDLEDYMEVINEDDADNHYSFSVGIVESN